MPFQDHLRQGLGIARVIVLTVVVICGGVLAIRAYRGPLQWPFTIDQPLRVQRTFAVSACLLLLISAYGGPVRARSQQPAFQEKAALADWRAPAAVTALTAAGFIGAPPGWPLLAHSVAAGLLAFLAGRFTLHGPQRNTAMRVAAGLLYGWHAAVVPLLFSAEAYMALVGFAAALLASALLLVASSLVAQAAALLLLAVAAGSSPGLALAASLPLLFLVPQKRWRQAMAVCGLGAALLAVQAFGPSARQVMMASRWDMLLGATLYFPIDWGREPRLWQPLAIAVGTRGYIRAMRVRLPAWEASTLLLILAGFLLLYRQSGQPAAVLPVVACFSLLIAFTLGHVRSAYGQWIGTLALLFLHGTLLRQHLP